MKAVSVDFSRTVGKIKPMHAVNNGPIITRNDQSRGNEVTYAAAKIPFARTHDASFCGSYGGYHTVDVPVIFPNFDADVEDPDSYDFAVTDVYMEQIISVGTEVYYRLGNKIEHEVKKYGTLPPPDFDKWARICEHIIRHYNEGWANGFRHGIRYWEIWNEPDLDPDDSPNKRNWGGTQAEFFDLYEKAAKHLKTCFPSLKIGGPALAGNLTWGEEFLAEMQKRKAPMDFFSWHIYANDPRDVEKMVYDVEALMKRYGYGDAESILNEWNYVLNWNTRFIESIKAIISMKGAAFASSVITKCQKTPLDMLMYYDARPSAFNGLWDFYTMEPLKGYYPYLFFSSLYTLGQEAECRTDAPELDCVAATDGKGNGALMVTYFENDENAPTVSFKALFEGTDKRPLRARLVDATHNGEEIPLTEDGIFSLAPNSVLLLETGV